MVAAGRRFRYVPRNCVGRQCIRLDARINEIRRSAGSRAGHAAVRTEL
jgi:hypothetical protein